MFVVEVMQQCIHFKVHGKVQGVFFRAFMQEKARELHLKGFVKNGEDNTVEGIMQGEKEQIEKMIQYCKRGPPGAVVEKVDVREETIKDDREGFKVQY